MPNLDADENIRRIREEIDGARMLEAENTARTYRRLARKVREDKHA